MESFSIPILCYLERSYIGSCVPSFKQTIARSRGQRPVMTKRALYSVAPNTIAKPVTKTPRGQEQRHVNGYTLRCLREQAKWPPT